MGPRKQGIGGVFLFLLLLLSLVGCGGGSEDDQHTPVNRLPSANAGRNQAVDAGTRVTLDGGMSSDPDGMIAGYRWGQVEGPTVFLPDPYQVSVSFDAPAVDSAVTLRFQLTVTDSEGAVDRADVSVTVRPVEKPLVSLSGTVTAYSTDARIAGATVSVTQFEDGDLWELGTAESDDSGYFEIQVHADPGVVHVRVDAEHFASQLAAVQLQEGVVSSSTHFILMPVDVVHTFQPTDIAVIRNQDQPLVNLPADSLVTADGGHPVGEATAMATVLDASLDPNVMPAALRGLDASTGVAEPIAPYGALDVTFVDANGNSLNLRLGQEARVSIPLAEARDPADAPSTLPLFYLSGDTGDWVQEGNAGLEQVAPGRWAYVGHVRHFTTWVAALWHEVVRIAGCVENHNGEPVAAAWVVAIGVDYTGSSVVTTDTRGQFAVHAGADSKVVLLAHAGTRNSYSEQRNLSTGRASLELNQCFVVSDDANDVLAKTLRVQLAATIEKLEETEATLAALRADYEVVLTDLTDAVAQIAELEAALAETEAELATCMAPRAAPPSHPDFKVELENCQANLFNVEAVLAMTQAELAACDAGWMATQAALEATSEALAIARAEFVVCQAGWTTAQEELAAAQAELAACDATRKEIQKGWDEARTNLAVAQAELAACDAGWTATQAELADCRAGWAATETAAAALDALLAQCQDELDALRQ